MFGAPANFLPLLALSNGSSGGGPLGTARNPKPFLVTVTHPKNNYSSRTPCSSLLPLLNAHAHAATSGKQGNFARKPSNHNKPSEGKVANPKMVSGLPSTADACHQTVPANKQVSRLGRASPALCAGSQQTPVCPQGNLHPFPEEGSNNFQPLSWCSCPGSLLLQQHWLPGLTQSRLIGSLA